MMDARVGIPSDISCLPLRNLVANEENLILETGSLAEVTRRFRSRELDAAFVSPIEYARESSEYYVIPGCALSSRSGVALYFRDGVRSVRTMAADPSRVSEIVLARIVLSEEFEFAPSILPMSGNDVKNMLVRAEGALLASDDVLKVEKDNRGYIDLAELWSELVGFPYVHGILCTREEVMNDKILPLLDLGNRLKNRKFSAGNIDSPDQTDVDEFLGRFSFSLDEETMGGLLEFIRYAHYHGILRDIPQLRLVQTVPPEFPES